MKDSHGKRFIKIAVIDPSGHLYGSELSLLEVLEGLDPAVFSPLVYLPKGAAFKAILDHAGIACREIFLPDGHMQSRWRKLWTYLRLSICLVRRRPDLIYVNEAGIMRPISLIACLYRLPILCQIQTIEDARWIGRFSRLIGWRTTYVCNSRFTALNAQVPERCKSTVYLGYKEKGLCSDDRDRPHEPFRAGILGRIGGSKGHDILIEAARIIAASKNCWSWQFRFIGDAVDPLEMQALYEKIKRYGLQDIVVMRGYRSDIKTEFAQLDLLLIPSRAEPFGRILCEAAEAGVPVLLSDSGGLGELSRRFEIGERHMPENAEDLARQLLRIRADYIHVNKQFHEGAKRLLNALDYKSYINVMTSIMVSASVAQPIAIEWYGRSFSQRSDTA